MVHTYKYQFAYNISEEITDLLLYYLKPTTINIIRKNINAITCVPLHKNKLKQRGFNQTELIAKRISNQLEIPFQSNLLIRKKETKTQAKLNKKQRKLNISNSFKINDNFNLKDLNILIIDDIATTLATLNENARIFKKAGVKKTWGLTIARD